MAEFLVPRHIHYGRGCICALEALTGKRAIVITGGEPDEGGTGKVRQALGHTGMAVRTHFGVPRYPGLRMILDGAKAMREFKPDWIVGVGDGSVIDAAKIMWIFYEHPEARLNQLAPGAIPPLRRAAGFAAVPGRWGTGGEVGMFASVTDEDTGTQRILWDQSLTPDIAVIDPDLGGSSAAAPVCMEALGSALDAYLSKNGSCFTEPMARDATIMILKNFSDACDGKPAAMERMCYAKSMGGIAASNTGAGLLQAMGSRLRGVIDIPVGEICGLLLPNLIRLGTESCTSRYAELVSALEEKNCEGENCGEMLAKAVEKIRFKAGMPGKLADLGVTEEAVGKRLPMMAQEIIKEDAAARSSVSLDEKEMTALIRAACHGKAVELRRDSRT